ncbi:MAG TPA: transcription antitermination factor NusB [Nitriliruptorales bacterium]|nr:transcription antitermination factor NusB [Nitriliruptorales bacterium]
MNARAPRRSTTSLSRHDARQRALEVLYEADVRRQDIGDTLQRVTADVSAAPLDDFARELVRGVADHIDELDEVIGRHARDWTVRRMPVVDRNVLRLATFELLFHSATPPAVVIDEAVELAKALSTDDSPRYVNGVLSAILRAEVAPGG